MKKATLLLTLLAIVPALADHPSTKKDDRPAYLMDGLSNLHHPVSTKNPAAQKFFDQGLRLLYAFNHDEARRSFLKAAELDPDLAMAWWGVALVLGPNYNVDAEPEQIKTAYDALQKALKLSAKVARHEEDYILALAKRYPADPKADKDTKKKHALAYKVAMGKLAKKYPDDLDAATLYAESAMNLRPWELWSHDGKPAEDTMEILEVLESVLARNPDHIGANHYYIHAIEASPRPERGLPAAYRLKNLNLAAGHLAHMPAHIFHRIGDFAEAALANEKAIAADEAYIAKAKPHGIYPLMYYSHNIHFLAVARAMEGRLRDAKKAADKLVAHIDPHVKDMPMLEGFLPTPMLILVRFRQWEGVLNQPAPDAKLVPTRMIRHFARGLAFVANKKLPEAQKEWRAFQELKKSLPKDMMFGERNKAHHVLSIPEGLLAAEFALAEGNNKIALVMFEQAVRREDELNYIEPADWYIPVREHLGGILLSRGEAAAAEKVFRDDLVRNRRNGRSLFGLMHALRAQNRLYEASLVEQEFRAAWGNASVQLKVEDL